MSDRADRRGWHIYARLVCEHQQFNDCARPQWVRVLVMWHPVLGKLISASAVLRWVHWAFPVLIGGRALMCANCHRVAYQSRLSEWIARFVAFVTCMGEDTSDAILMIDEDLKHLSERTLAELNPEDI